MERIVCYFVNEIVMDEILKSINEKLNAKENSFNCSDPTWARD